MGPHWRGHDGWTPHPHPGIVIGEFGNTPDDNQRLIDPREVGGGAILHATTNDGMRLNELVCQVRTEFFLDDGTPVVWEAGQIINVVNEDYTPSFQPREKERVGGFLQHEANDDMYIPTVSIIQD